MKSIITDTHKNKKKKKSTIVNKIISFLKSEIFSYLLFGICTTLINIIIFQLLYSILNIPTLISNAIAWIFSVAFAYVTNRIYVFHSSEKTLKGIIREVTSFIGARMFSLLFDELIMWLMVDVMGYTIIERIFADIANIEISDSKSLIAKVCANVIVVILNYVFSKLFIFKTKK